MLKTVLKGASAAVSILGLLGSIWLFNSAGGSEAFWRLVAGLISTALLALLFFALGQILENQQAIWEIVRPRPERAAPTKNTKTYGAVPVSKSRSIFSDTEKKD